MSTSAQRVLSLGAGVQSTTLFWLAVAGEIPKPDVAVFADTGWEPAAVYEHLKRLERAAGPAGIPILRVSNGNIRSDALDPDHKFVSMPTFTVGPCQTCVPRGHLGVVYNLTAEISGKQHTDYSGTCPKCRGEGLQHGMGRRQCTAEYKLRAIMKKIRELLGYPHPMHIPASVYAEQQIGISRDEIGRVRDSDVRYLRNAYPLLDLGGAADGREGWTRPDCRRYLKSIGWESTPRSACIGCPFRGNREWRQMRDERPAEWADAVAFDRALRAVARVDGIREYLHRSCRPLDEAPIDRVTSREWVGRQTTVFDQVADAELEEGDPDGCGPFTCRSGQPVTPAA